MILVKLEGANNTFAYRIWKKEKDDLLWTQELGHNTSYEKVDDDWDEGPYTTFSKIRENLSHNPSATILYDSGEV